MKRLFDVEQHLCGDSASAAALVATGVGDPQVVEDSRTSVECGDHMIELHHGASHRLAAQMAYEPIPRDDLRDESCSPRTISVARRSKVRIPISTPPALLRGIESFPIRCEPAGHLLSFICAFRRRVLIPTALTCGIPLSSMFLIASCVVRALLSGYFRTMSASVVATLRIYALFIGSVVSASVRSNAFFVALPPSGVGGFLPSFRHFIHGSILPDIAHTETVV